MFRKPTKKIQRRVFNANDDDEDGEPEPPPPPVISRQKKENKPAKCTPTLSFADEEDNDGEVFKVKKSTQSKRLSKKREKEKKNTSGDSKYENNIPEEKMEIEQEKPKAKKKITLEGLILSGRDALAANGTGDVEDEEMAEQEEETEGGFHRYRAESVRAALAAGVEGIPDAALIHAARKTRQQARELGGEYIPIRTENNEPGSRLQVDDDGSGDEEEGRIHVRGLHLPSDKPKRGTAATEAEMDSEAEEWEEQQMQKAVTMGDVTVADPACDLNPFAARPLPPPPPRLSDGPAHLRPLAVPGGAPVTPAQLLDALRTRLKELQMARELTANNKSSMQDRLLQAIRIKESREARAAPLENTYKQAQSLRAYVTDLVECLDEKMPRLETLEARALALHKRRCEVLQERRRADVRDEAQDVLALAARPGCHREPDPEDKVRRTAEREGRRRARRLRREAAGGGAGGAGGGGAGGGHRAGDSSDDEPAPAERHRHTTIREEILTESATLFSDALGAWRSIRGVTARLARWRRRCPALYTDTQLPACLPRLLAPYVRHQMILWNPLADEDNEDFERMDWYKCLMMYGVRRERVSDDSWSSSSSEGEGAGRREEPAVSEHAAREDPDLMLVPTLVQKVVLPKLTELIECAFDPMSVRACVRLRGVLLRLSTVPPAPPAPRAAALRRACVATRARLAAALAADVMLPALPAQLMDGPGGQFWKRCLGAGVRLLRAFLALCPPPAALRADALALALIGTLGAAAAAAPGPSAATAAAALASTLPRSDCPLRGEALGKLAELAQAALNKLQTDNPMHLKALEQARAVLAEAKAFQKK